MYGTILGDMVGSPYERGGAPATKDFPLFSRYSHFTDDTVMSVAVAEALLLAKEQGVTDDERATKELLIDSMHKWGRRYPNAGYGGRFIQWIHCLEREPYNSWGNGSAMRVSAAGWLFDDMDSVRRIARWTAEVTHDHPEGVKGAESVASAIFMARSGCTKDEIKAFIEDNFGYDLSRTCDEIRPNYKFDVSCQGSVPEAITAFLEGKDLEDVVRTAVSLGGDTDTIGAMAGSIAEAFYGVPEKLVYECGERLPDDISDVVLQMKAEMKPAEKRAE